MQNSSTFDCQCDKVCKISEHLDIKNCTCKKRLFGQLVLACEDEILNKTNISTIVEAINIMKAYAL